MKTKTIVISSAVTLVVMVCLYLFGYFNGKNSVPECVCEPVNIIMPYDSVKNNLKSKFDSINTVKFQDLPDSTKNKIRSIVDQQTNWTNGRK